MYHKVSTIKPIVENVDTEDEDTLEDEPIQEASANEETKIFRPKIEDLDYFGCTDIQKEFIEYLTKAKKKTGKLLMLFLLYQLNIVGILK